METCTGREVLAVTFVGCLVVVSGTEAETVIVGVFHTQAPLYLLHLLLETVGCIPETLEDTRYGRHIVILALHAVGIFLLALTFLLFGIGRHEQLVGIGRDGETVIVVERDGEVDTQTEVGGNELCIVIASVTDFRTDVVDVQTPCQTALAVAHHEIAVAVHGNVGSKSLSGTGLGGIVIGDVTVDEAESHTHGETLTEHTAVTEVKGELIRTDAHGILILTEKDFTQREVAERGTQGRIVTDAVETGQVGQVDVVDQLAQPRRVARRDTRTGNVEGVLGRVPVL